MNEETTTLPGGLFDDLPKARATIGSGVFADLPKLPTERTIPDNIFADLPKAAVEPPPSDWLGVGEEVAGLGNSLARGTLNFFQSHNLNALRRVGDIPKEIETEQRLLQEATDYLSGKSPHPSVALKGFVTAGDEMDYRRQMQRRLGDSGRKIAQLQQEQARIKAALPGITSEFQSNQETLAQIPQTEAQKEFQKEETPWWKFFENPVELATLTTAESAPVMVQSLAAAPLGPLGVAVATGAGSYNAEQSARVFNAMSQAGVDLKNPEAVMAWLADRAKSDPALAKADLAAMGPATFDALTGGLAGRWLRNATGGGTKKVLGAMAKESGMQMAGGGGGSIAGSALAGEKVDWKDVVLEMAAEIAPTEAMQNVAAEHGLTIENLVQNRALDKSIAESANAQALANSLPSQKAESFASYFRDGVPRSSSEAQPQGQQTDDQNSRPPEAVATPAPAGASPEQQARVRAELRALPGAQEDLAVPMAPLTEEQTSSGINEMPAPDETPATKADLLKLVDFIKNGGANPFVAKPAKVQQEQTEGTEKPTSGQPDETAKPAQTITGSNVQTGTEMPVQQKAGAATTIADRPGGETVTAASETTPAQPAKPTFTVGQRVQVALSNRSGKTHLARITQLQPDGSAQVQIEGEKVQRWVKPEQVFLTKTDRARADKAEELSSIPEAQREQVKADAAEFTRLVEDYAPQLEWAPGEAYDRNTVMQEQGVENARLRNAAIQTAMRKVLPGGQGNSIVDRARALPALEAYLKQQFPDDNSIANRRVLEDFGRSEAKPQETATVERDQAMLDQLAARYPGKAFLQGLRAVGRSPARGPGKLAGQPGGKSSGKGALPAAGASAVTELERIFGVRVIFVKDATFAGVKPAGVKLILINTKADAPVMALAGHELLHHIASTHPGLYADFKREAAALLKNSEQFRAELARKGYAELTDDTVTEEMFADVLGDTMLDPVFLQELAKAEPNLFKRFARVAASWLEKLIAKAKAVAGFESAQYVTDLTEMRHRLLNLLRDAGRQTQFERAGIEADAGQSPEQGQDAFSRDSYIIGQVNNAKELGDTEFEVVERRHGASSRDAGKRYFQVVGKQSGNGYFNNPTSEQAEERAAQMRAAMQPTRQDKSGQGDMFSLEKGPVWRSNIQGALGSWQNKGTPEQLRAHLAKTKGALDEAEWIGLDEFLKDKTSVTKQEVADFVRANQVDVQEVTKGAGLSSAEQIGQEMFGKTWLEMTDQQRQEANAAYRASADTHPKFENYQLPGGENYRELLLTLPEAKVDPKYAEPLTSLPEGWVISRDYSQREGRQYAALPPGQVHGAPYNGYRYATAAEAREGTRILLNNEAASNAEHEARQQAEKQQFQSSHFDEPNILAHVRFNERTDADGKRVLFIEEVQSDWHQKGRKGGYKTGEDAAKPFAVRSIEQELGRFQSFDEAQNWASDYRDRTGDINVRVEHEAGADAVPNAPFKQTWPMLAMKRMIRYAADNGFDRIAWTTGEQQNDRYDLAKQVDSIKVTRASANDFEVKARKNGETLVNKAVEGKQGLADLIGKDLAEKAFAEVPEGDAKEYSGSDLKVGGKGMRKFYNEMLPSEVNKFVKKWGGRVGQTALSRAGGKPTQYADFADYQKAQKELTQVHSLDITPSMKGAALEGFDMFSRPDPAKQTAFTKLQEDIAQAEKELMAAIRVTVLPPDMRDVSKKDALAAKDDAARKLHRLLAEQLKLMTDIRQLDAARSPDQTADLISQTVDLLNAIQDEISERTARTQEIPTDLTKLRTDLQERLSMLKGWADDQSDEAAQGARVEKPARRDDRFTELESASDPDRNTLPQWLEKLQAGLRFVTSPIPELPITGPRAQTSALFRRGYRLFAVENNRVRKEAQEKVSRVVEPLAKLGRKPADNDALARYYKLHNALQRAEMDAPRRKAIMEQMRKLEETALNKDPFNLFRRLVLYKDLRWRATYLKNDSNKPITLPLGLTAEEVGAELRRLYQTIEQHPDGAAITEAVRRHYALTEELQQSILEHGEIIPESLRNPLYFPHHIADNWTGRIDRVRPKTEEDFRRYLIAPKGSPKLIQTDYLKAMLLHTADVLAHNARVDLVQKYWQPYDISEQLKSQHGEAWTMPWNIPSGYRLYSPFKKLALRMDYILSREVLADKLGVLFNDGDLRARMGETGKVVKVTPEDLHTALVAGEKIQWALPNEIADALDGINKREDQQENPNLLVQMFTPVRWLHTKWKQVKLFAPWNWIRYEYGNLTTDTIDKVLIADPGTAKQMARARREIWNAGQGEDSPEFKAAVREGILDTITEGEMQNLARLPEFEAFQTTKDRRATKARTVLESSMRGSRFRERVFRYAKFLADVERLRKGEQPVFGGAYHADIEALGQDVDGQTRMLDGEELVYAKAAEISLKTYGDYESLSVFSQFLRTYMMPFWSWQDVNFRYHANLLRNVADAVAARTMPKSQAARTIAGVTAVALARSAARVTVMLFLYSAMQELWNRWGGVALGLWDEGDDLEDKLSEADRRRSHIILGKDEKTGKVRVAYTPGAFADAAEWVGGTNLKRLFMEYATGQITMDMMVRDYAKSLMGDSLNKFVQGSSPAIKAGYEAMSGKATFPDVLDQRTIPENEKLWRIVGNLTDDRAVNVIRGALDKDYYSQPAGEQLQQIILQVRRRDPEQWAYYEAREDANEWEYRKTGKRNSMGDYTAPEAQALRNFRKAIYRGDVVNAERFYSRLLEFGYTAERLDASIRAQHPLANLNEEQRKEYTTTLTAKQKRELDLATQYYNRIKALDGREKQLFPKKGQAPRPNPELLKRIVETPR